jgi:hypothetical protein
MHITELQGTKIFFRCRRQVSLYKYLYLAFMGASWDLCVQHWMKIAGEMRRNHIGININHLILNKNSKIRG